MHATYYQHQIHGGKRPGAHPPLVAEGLGGRGSGGRYLACSIPPKLMSCSSIFFSTFSRSRNFSSEREATIPIVPSTVANKAFVSTPSTSDPLNPPTISSPIPLNPTQPPKGWGRTDPYP